MKSRAHIKSHPLHPILIPLPIAFFLGTVIAHGGGLWLGNEGWLQTASWLNVAGIIGGVLAAIPGIIDYTHTVPPQSSAKKRATQHGLLNTTVVLIFTFAFFYRRQEAVNHPLLIAGELLGIILLMISGWLGGTLVYRNQIGVDVRYANAGKWQEAHFDTTSGTIEVATADALKTNAMLLLHLKDKRIVLARTEEGYVAFDDRCPHRGGSLAGGSLMCGTVQCPWHGSQFSVRTGAVTAGPAKTGVVTYEVKEREGKVWLTV